MTRVGLQRKKKKKKKNLNKRGRTQTVVINTDTWQIQDDTVTVQMVWWVISLQGG
jgi:hypothetical protein